MREDGAFGNAELEESRRMRTAVIDELAEYLEGYIEKATHRKGYSKHAIMGPAGKLLSAVMSEKLESEDALIGYILNIHENMTGYSVKKEHREHLEKGVRMLLELKKKTPNRNFAKIMREIDYGIYYRRMRHISELIEKKRSGGESHE
ncbi:MAG: hypothetical protein QMC96_04825 [Methanomicrobiales archaeon]|nr:hypothetical protein [Methanomicrobiales archaeon]